MSPELFLPLIAKVTARIAGRPLNARLADFLKSEFPESGADFEALFRACEQAIAAGWMCSREGGGIKYGRVIKASASTHGFSVDVVDMDCVAGPHHRHPHHR